MSLTVMVRFGLVRSEVLLQVTSVSFAEFGRVASERDEVAILISAPWR